MYWIRLLIVLGFAGITSVCYSQNVKNETTDSVETKRLLAKIKLDLNQIDENGLTGLPDGKRTVDYEFCIPVDRKKRRTVHTIDPSVRFHLGSHGRSGCSGQYLCIGSGGNQKILLRLAKLDYIKEINPCYWE